jgi:hypothetical protein
MIPMRKLSIMMAAAIAAVASANAVHAAVIASDTATNPAYAPGSADTAADELNGLNGGTGFGPWSVTDIEVPPATGATATSPSGNGGSFVNSANNVTNDGANGTIRNPAPVFDVYDNGNPSSSSNTGATLNSSLEIATRPFLSPITPGGSFSFSETLHNLRAVDASGNTTSTVGFQLLDASGNVLLDLHLSGGGPGYQETDANQSNLTLFSTDASHSGSASRNLDYNINESDTVTINITDAAGDFNIVTTGHRGSTYADGGQINMATGGPAAFAIYDNDGGTGSDVSVNNLTESVTATPEPASLSLAGLGLGALILRRRRAQ